MKQGIVFSLLGAIATAVGFAIGFVWGWRVLGTLMIIAGAWTLWTQRATYVVPGRGPSALTGGSAVVAALVNFAIGIAIIINAEELAVWVRRVI